MTKVDVPQVAVMSAGEVEPALLGVDIFRGRG